MPEYGLIMMPAEDKKSPDNPDLNVPVQKGTGFFIARADTQEVIEKCREKKKYRLLMN